MGKKNKGKGKGARKRKARMADLDKDMIAANKRAHLQSKRDDQLFVVDSKPGQSAVASRASNKRTERKRRGQATTNRSSLSSSSSSSDVPVVDVPLVFEAAPTRAVLPGVAKNLQNQLHSSKRVGGDRHQQNVKQVEDGDLYDVWDDSEGSSSSSSSSTSSSSSSINDPWTESLVKKPAVRHSKRFASTKTRLTAADVVPEGASYNPESRAHAELVNLANADKLMRARKLAHLKAQLNPPAPPTDSSLLESDDEEEGDVGSSGSSGCYSAFASSSSSSSSSSSTASASTIAPASAPATITTASTTSSTSTTVRHKPTKRLTTAQRNKQARQKILQDELQARKQKKSLNSQLSHLKELKKLVVLEENEKKEKKDRVEKWREERDLEPAPLKYGGKISKNQPKIDVVDVHALPTSMRNMQAVGNPVLDRMHNMLRRNVMEQGKKVRMKKPKQKKLERNRGWKLDVDESDDDEE